MYEFMFIIFEYMYLLFLTIKLFLWFYSLLFRDMSFAISIMFEFCLKDLCTDSINHVIPRAKIHL